MTKTVSIKTRCLVHAAPVSRDAEALRSGARGRDVAGAESTPLGRPRSAPQSLRIAANRAYFAQLAPALSVTAPRMSPPCSAALCIGDLAGLTRAASRGRG